MLGNWLNNLSGHVAGVEADRSPRERVHTVRETRVEREREREREKRVPPSAREYKKIFPSSSRRLCVRLEVYTRKK